MNTKHLKAKILDLAIRGKLVPQDSSEGNAADLLQKIREEKNKCHPELDSGSKQKKLKEDKNASFIIKADDGKHYEQFTDGTLKDIEDEIPFEIPENWCWCRLKEITDKLVDGDHNPPAGIKEKSEYFMASSQNINNNGLVKLSDVRYFDKKTFEIEHKRTEATAGDIFFTSVGTLGRSCIYQGGYNICFQRSVSILHTLIYNKYLKYYFDSNYYQQYVVDHATGTAQLGFYLNEMSESLIIVPPLSEQKRIVSAIEKAFEQIDIIEKNKLNLKTYIKQTKSKILDLAIHGKLVEPNPQEGNAFELLEKIRNEKAELIKQKKLKEDKNASFIIKADNGKHYEQFADGSLKDVEEEIPFEIPENWCWCRLAEICELKGGKRIPAGLSATKEKTNHIYIRVSDMKNDSISDEDLVYIDESIFNKIKQYTISKDDLYLTIAGTIGRVGEVPVKFHNMNLTENALKLTNIGVNKHFLLIFLKTPFVQDYFSSSFHQVAMPKLSMTTTSKTFIPLPPLSEQKRIVAKIEHVFEQLDVLEKSMGE